MTRCPTEELAAAFPALTPELDQHVGRCSTCRATWRGYEELADLVRGLPQPAEPSPLCQRRARRTLVARARLRAQVPGRAARYRRRFAGVAAAAAVLLIGGSVLRSQVMRGGETPTEPEPAAPGRSETGSAPPIARADPDRATPGSRPAPRDPIAPIDPAPSVGNTFPPHVPSAAGRRPRGWPSTPTAILEARRLHEMGVPGLPWRPRRPGRRPSFNPLPRREGSSPALGSGSPGGRPPGLTDPTEPAKQPERPERPDESPDGESGCVERSAAAQDQCLIERGLDPATAGNTEEEVDAIITCQAEAWVPTFQACCAATPDEGCEEEGGPTDEPGGAPPVGGTCADILFETFDQCLADAGVSVDDTSAYADEMIGFCWIDVANGAFEECCAANPDETCEVE